MRLAEGDIANPFELAFAIGFFLLVLLRKINLIVRVVLPLPPFFTGCTFHYVYVFVDGFPFSHPFSSSPSLFLPFIAFTRNIHRTDRYFPIWNSLSTWQCLLTLPFPFLQVRRIKLFLFYPSLIHLINTTLIFYIAKPALQAGIWTR